MIAVDTNILVYSHRQESPWHATALATVRKLIDDGAPWAIPWPCIHEFLAIVTHPRIYVPPTPLSRALDAVGAWLAAPNVVLLAESVTYWDRLRRLLKSAQVAAGAIHDGHVAALCLDYGIQELWTADRDFGRFPGLRTRNPLIHP